MKDNMISNEGLAIEIKNLSIQIADLKSVMAMQASSYVNKEIFELRMKDLENKQLALQLEIARVEKSTKKANWKTHTLTALFTAVLVTVTLYVVNDIIRR